LVIVNKAKLKMCAQLLDQEIARSADTIADAWFLARSRDLQQATSDAKSELIDEPRQNAGLTRWLMDSNVQDLKSLTRVLLDFVYLLRADEDVAGYQ
jgi:hypothetical protein